MGSGCAQSPRTSWVRQPRYSRAKAPSTRRRQRRRRPGGAHANRALVGAGRPRLNPLDCPGARPVGRRRDLDASAAVVEAEAMSFLTSVCARFGPPSVSLPSGRAQRRRARTRPANEHERAPDRPRRSRPACTSSTTVLLVRAPDLATLAERLDMLRLEMRSLGFEPEVSTFQLADAWHSVVPGSNPAPIAERNLDKREPRREPSPRRGRSI